MESYKNEDKAFHSHLNMPRRKQKTLRNEELYVQPFAQLISTNFSGSSCEPNWLEKLKPCPKSSHSQQTGYLKGGFIAGP